ncbi:hypothetical protein MRB53_024387 [Persea americana]|uniref:Uncharacterized protein n=1 Tax=Persea americana TaxID=3435 RepID=A0ACC2LDG0_PERAE|nr:hypothetical protein MRB53_024387 [Persea americana]
MAKFSVGGEGEGASSTSCPRKRRRADSADEGFDETSFFEDEEETATKISITIDPDVLDCSICLEPLIPPVFQCDNGHIACSSCCTKLKNKCHSCSLAIYARCLAIEKVVESIKTSCRNARYGCKEEVGYTHRTSHEETCIYSPCSCPISGCTFLGSSEQLSLHFSSMHWASATRFRYNCPFLVSFDKSEPFIILQSEDGHLFLLYNSKETIGNAISVTSIGPRSPVGGFSYDLITRDGGRTLRLQSFTKSLLRRMETSPSIDFLLVPNGFHSCSEQPKMEVCIWSTR